MSRQRIEWAVWGLLGALTLAPVWSFGWFPTQDGACHVENAGILLALARGAPAAIGEWFVVNPTPTPNWLGHAILSALLALVPAAVAEKLLVSACVLGLPLAARYCLRAFGAEAGAPAVLAFPLSLNCLLHYGFYNFCLSLPLFFVALGLWLRGAGLAAMAAALTLLYGCHVVSWALALLALALFRPRCLWRLAVAAAPSVALALHFFAGRAGAAAAPVSWEARWYGLTHFTTSVFSYALAAQWTGMALALFLAVAAAAHLRRAHRAAVAFSAAVLALYFAAPQGAAGGSSLLERLNLYFFLSLLLWLAESPPGAAWRRALTGGAVAFTTLLVGLNLPWYREAARQTAEMISAAPHIAPGEAFLPLLYDSRGPGPLRDLYGEAMRHVPSRIATLRGAVNLDNYQAETDLFPIRFAPGRNPGVFAGAIEALPPRVRLDSPLIAAVLVWDPLRTAPPPPAAFTLVFTSPGGSTRLYRPSQTAR